MQSQCPRRSRLSNGHGYNAVRQNGGFDGGSARCQSKFPWHSILFVRLRLRQFVSRRLWAKLADLLSLINLSADSAGSSRRLLRAALLTRQPGREPPALTRGSNGASRKSSYISSSFNAQIASSWSHRAVGLSGHPPHRSLGSSASRKPSPRMLNARTVRNIARPGHTAIHGALVRKR